MFSVCRYYDLFLQNYLCLAKDKGWKSPLLGELGCCWSRYIRLQCSTSVRDSQKELFQYFMYWFRIVVHSFLCVRNCSPVRTLTEDVEIAVALSYSPQIRDEAVPVDATDVNIDALVSSNGILTFSSQAEEQISSS
jgi:hypothetical protein